MVCFTDMLISDDRPGSPVARDRKNRLGDIEAPCSPVYAGSALCSDIMPGPVEFPAGNPIQQGDAVLLSGPLQSKFLPVISK